MRIIAYLRSWLFRNAQLSLWIIICMIGLLSACELSTPDQEPTPLPTVLAVATSLPNDTPTPLPYIAPGPSPQTPSPFLTPTPVTPMPIPRVVTATIDLSLLQSEEHAAHHLLLYSGSGSDSGLMLADIEDNRQIWLTQNLQACRPHNESYPERGVWSADGRFLAIFCRAQNIYGVIYLLDRQRGIFRAAPNDPGYGIVASDVIWSPQGHQLLYRENRTVLEPEVSRPYPLPNIGTPKPGTATPTPTSPPFSPYYEVWKRMDAETGVNSRLMEFGSTSSAIWTPDGQNIILAGRVFEGSQWGWAIYTMNSDGTKSQQITQIDRSEHIYFEGWSADGKQLYLNLQSISPSDQGYSWSLDLENGELTEVAGAAMTLSPDSRYGISNVRGGYSPGLENMSWGLFSIERKESVLHGVNTANWLSDGRLLISECANLEDPNQKGRLYTSTVTGYQHTILSDLSGCVQASASPDNTLFAVTNQDYKAAQIRIVDSDGQQIGTLSGHLFGIGTQIWLYQQLP